MWPLSEVSEAVTTTTQVDHQSLDHAWITTHRDGQ
ncbi:hypothetical protein Pcinc_012696, partial [Petrolisthes cinctipes]